MNKLRSNINLTGNKQNSKESLKNVVSAKQKDQVGLKQLEPKKKRTALENISNAASVAKDASKKSRFSNFSNPVFGISIGKKDQKLNSKENTGVPLKCAKSNESINKNSAKENQVVIVKTHNVDTEALTNANLVSDCEKLEISEKCNLVSLTQNENQASVRKIEDILDWEDIDLLDPKDEFNVCDYAALIFKYYRERQDKFSVGDYLRSQPTLNKQMRHLLIDWMVEVQQQLEFNHEVLYLSVKLLDLYLNSKRIDKEKLQLLGGAAMFIACKYEERIPPAIDDFIYVSDNAYNRHDLIKMEIDILKTVKFDLGVPLSYTFLRRYAKCIHADMKFLTLARYILELALQEYLFAYVNDSLKACAALYLALKITYYNDLKTNTKSTVSANEWTSTLIHYTEAFLEDFVEYVPLMNNLIKAAPNAKYKTIFKKYSHQVFYEVAKLQALQDEEIELLISPSYNKV